MDAAFIIALALNGTVAVFLTRDLLKKNSNDILGWFLAVANILLVPYDIYQIIKSF